jgi:hypothetical protein
VTDLDLVWRSPLAFIGGGSCKSPARNSFVDSDVDDDELLLARKPKPKPSSGIDMSLEDPSVSDSLRPKTFRLWLVAPRRRASFFWVLVLPYCLRGLRDGAASHAVE